MSTDRQGSDRDARHDGVGDGAGLLVLLNAAAGDGSGDAQCAVLRSALPGCVVVEPGAEESFTAALDRLLDGLTPQGCLGIIGGDGSVNAAASRALDRGVPMLVIPGGTLNHFARDLGLTDVQASIAAFKAGDPLGVDVGELDGRLFLNTASFGAYPALVDARERLSGRIGKWPAAVVALVRVLRGQRPVHVRIDGEELRVSMIFIGNCRYEPSGLVPRRRACLADGMFDVRYAIAPNRFGRSRLAVALLLGSLLPGSMIRQRMVEDLTITSAEGPLRLACDGETFDASSPTIEVRKHGDRLRTYGPPRGRKKAAMQL